jgi:trehalose 6-phosphate synthase/phosphatase
MSEAEKARRHKPLYQVVTTHTSHSWAALLVKRLLGQINKQNTARKTPFIPKEKLLDHYRNTTKRLLLFDYDVSRGVLIRWILVTDRLSYNREPLHPS